MRINLLTVLFLLFSAVCCRADVKWDFSQSTNPNVVFDQRGKNKLKSSGQVSKEENSVLSPRGSYYSGSSQNFSLVQGTYKICFKIKEYNNWDGLLQTHIGFKIDGRAKYMGLGFKRVSTGIFQAYDIPAENGIKNITTLQNAMLDDGHFHNIILTYQDGKAKDGKGVTLYIDGKVIGKVDYDSSKCWNKGSFMLGTSFNKHHAPELWIKSFEYSDQVLPVAKSQIVKKNNNVVNNKSNLALNGSFERIRKDGWVKNWSKCNVFSVDKESSQMGSQSFRYNNSDPDKYVFPESPLNLTPGKRYKLNGWIKVKDVKGPGVGACIAIEYYNANSKYLGGTYTKGMKGTDSRWTEFDAVTNTIPEGTARCRLICFVRQGMTGTAWFDNITVTPFHEPFFRGLSTDIYRNESASGDVKVKVGINWDSDKGKFNKEQVRLSLTITDSPGKIVGSAKFLSIKDNAATFEFNCSRLQPGEYKLKCALKAADGKVLEIIDGTFTRLKQPVKRKVYIDEHKRLIVDGKPFFPLGTYWSKVNEQELKIYSKSPFNCVMPYQILSKSQMDLIDKYKLKTFFSLKDCYWGTRWCPKEIKSIADESDFILNKIKMFKDHPALLAWYVNDERPLSMLDRLIARQNFIKKHDVNHPTWTVLCKLDDISALLPTYDVIGTDPYPVPDIPAGLALEWTRITRQATFKTRAVWMVPQIFNWAAYSKVESERKRFRAPTLAEMRSMAWQCIAGGANGLVFYSWFDVRNMDKTDPFEKRWKEICTVADEIKKMTPVLLSVEPVPEYFIKKSPKVACRLYAQNKAVFLVVANSSQKTEKVEVKFSVNFKDAKAVLGSDTFTYDSAAGNLTIKLAPLEPKVIKLMKRF